jgi:hypothetical protein
MKRDDDAAPILVATGQTVATLVATVTDDDLRAAARRLYYSVDDFAPYLEMRGQLRAMAAAPSITDCALSRRWSGDEPPQSTVDVSGTVMGDSELYAIEFTPWPEWLGVAVYADLAMELAPADMLMNILWEMSFLGFDEDEISSIKDELGEVVQSLPEDLK